MICVGSGSREGQQRASADAGGGKTGVPALVAFACWLLLALHCNTQAQVRDTRAPMAAQHD